MPPHQPPQSEEQLFMGYDCIPNPLCGWMVGPSGETGISFPVIQQAPALQYNFNCAAPSAPATTQVQPGALVMPAAALQYNHLLPAQYCPACYAPGDLALCIFNLAFITMSSVILQNKLIVIVLLHIWGLLVPGVILFTLFLLIFCSHV